jgi:hypothetical protein
MNKILAIVLMALLAGCATTGSQSTIVYEKKTIEVVPVDKALTEPCQTVTPPTVAEYMALSKDGREDLLTRYATALAGSVKYCSNEKAAIRSIQEKQLAIIQKFNQEAEARAANSLKEQ